MARLGKGTKNLTANVPIYVKDKLEVLAKESDMTLSEFIRFHLSEIAEKSIAYKKEIKEIKIEFKEINYIGLIPCGKPTDIYADTRDTKQVPTDKLKGHDPKNCVVFQAHGDSMKEVNINDGDLCILDGDEKFTKNISGGEIILALHNNQSTLKRYIVNHNNGDRKLKAENLKYDDIEITSDDEFECQGVYVGKV